MAHSRRDAEGETQVGVANDTGTGTGTGDGAKIAPAAETSASSAREEADAAAPNARSDGAVADEPKEAGDDRRGPRIKSRLLDRISNLSKA